MGAITPHYPLITQSKTSPTGGTPEAPTPAMVNALRIPGRSWETIQCTLLAVLCSYVSCTLQGQFEEQNTSVTFILDGLFKK